MWHLNIDSDLDLDGWDIDIYFSKYFECYFST